MTKQVIINRFDGGMTSDARGEYNEAQLIQHFDNFTRKHSLIPFKNTESAYADQNTYWLKNFQFYNGKLYGLGRKSDTLSYIKIFETGANEVSDPTFTASTTAEGTSGSNLGLEALFIEYKGALFGYSGGVTKNGIFSYTISTNTLLIDATTVLEITATSVAQGLVHSKDDILYLPITTTAGTFIYYKNGAGAITLGLTLPTNYIITSICEYGNYLAIACRPRYRGAVNSKVFLWDRDATLTTVSETIDWGVGDLATLENIDGYLIGISIQADEENTGAKLVFKKYGGGGAIQFKEIPMAFSSSLQFLPKQKYNNRLYFGLGLASIFGSTSKEYSGIWSVGRNGEYNPFSVIMERVVNNGTAVSSIFGFINILDYLFVSYSDTAGTTVALSKSNDQALYSTISTYRTTLNPGISDGDKFKKKQLVSVGLHFKYYTATSPSVELQYAVDGGSFTSIFTNSTSTDTYQETNIVTGGTNFTAGREYEFKIISKGVEVHELVYNYEVMKSLI